MYLEKNLNTRAIYRRLLALEDKIFGLPFPKMERIKQITNSHCGPAVISALYSNLGVKTSQRGIVASLRLQKKILQYGLNLKELARASKIIGKNNFTFWKKEEAKISDLDAIINKYNYPAAVEWQGVFYEDEDEDNGHYCVITKIDRKSGTIRVLDPYPKFAGVDRKFKIKAFEKRWWDQNEIKVSGTSKRRTIKDTRMIFLITPKGETWPQKLGLKRA